MKPAVAGSTATAHPSLPVEAEIGAHLAWRRGVGETAAEPFRVVEPGALSEPVDEAALRVELRQLKRIAYIEETSKFNNSRGASD